MKLGVEVHFSLNEVIFSKDIPKVSFPCQIHPLGTSGIYLPMFRKITMFKAKIICFTNLCGCFLKTFNSTIHKNDIKDFNIIKRSIIFLLLTHKIKF